MALLYDPACGVTMISRSLFVLQNTTDGINSKKLRLHESTWWKYLPYIFEVDLFWLVYTSKYYVISYLACLLGLI